MPAATPIKQREEIVRRREQGESLADIARGMNLAYRTVRHVWRHYEKTGEVRPRYAGCVHTDIRKDPAIYEQAIALKRAHPRWGAGLIWVELVEIFGEADLPSERTLQRWFQRAGVARARPQVAVAEGNPQRGVEAHEVWAIDARAEMRLADGSYACWLGISDEGSGAVLTTALFPPAPLVRG